MALRVYNTLTKEKETFVPVEPGRAKMYVCGVTPYNHPHIGNARPFITWDVIRRWLEFSGYDVLHVQNFTDVDDKIIAAANKEGSSWDEISGRYIKSYFEVMDKLNIRRAHVYPRVSTHIPEIISMVNTLVENGHAYVVDGDVYFKVESFDGYGKLSGRTLDDMQAGARVDVDERKIHPMDFALWKSAKPGEPAWESPWGPGRPGWHIECSAMSLKYLGETFDFHGGGSDLIFPHHENEIAQSEATTGHEPFVKYWLHNGFITVHEEKMSKSLGNFFMVRDILEHFEPETLRFFILATHYRSPLDFNDERLKEAARSLERLRVAKNNLTELAAAEGQGPNKLSAELAAQADADWTSFAEAMDDDFNTALAISYLFALAKTINIYYQAVISGEVKPDGKLTTRLTSVLERMSGIIGIFETKDESISEGENASEGETALMAALIAWRADAKQAKDYATADALRTRLNDAGYILEDTPQGARWKKK